MSVIEGIAKLQPAGGEMEDGVFFHIQVLDAPEFYPQTQPRRVQGPCPRLSSAAPRADGLMVPGGPGEPQVALGAGL